MILWIIYYFNMIFSMDKANISRLFLINKTFDSQGLYIKKNLYCSSLSKNRPKNHFLLVRPYGRAHIFQLIFFSSLVALSETVWENRLYEKIEFFISTSHVDFQKAHIKLSNLANFQNFWTIPRWLAVVRKKHVKRKKALF
jgi:hypothetical protein